MVREKSIKEMDPEEPTASTGSSAAGNVTLSRFEETPAETKPETVGSNRRPNREKKRAARPASDVASCGK